MSDEFIQEEGFVPSPETTAAVDAALKTIAARSFSERNPELGNMIKCQVCQTRHRANERKCEQVFTYNKKGYVYYREDEKQGLVPDYRTAIRPDESPTKRQVVGSAAFAKKRYHPHPNGVKLLVIDYTREAFEKAGFDTEDKENFQKNLQIARRRAVRKMVKLGYFGFEEAKRRGLV
jgi:hypothetical protein